MPVRGWPPCSSGCRAGAAGAADRMMMRRNSQPMWAMMERAVLVALSLPLAWGAMPMLPGGCELLKLPAGASPSTDEERGCFNDWKDEKRLLRHGIPGCCGTPDTFCLDKPPVGLDKELWDGTCEAAKMTPAMCGAMCWALGAVATDGPYTLAGVEAGNQCCERASCTCTPSAPNPCRSLADGPACARQSATRRRTLL